VGGDVNAVEGRSAGPGSRQHLNHFKGSVAAVGGVGGLPGNIGNNSMAGVGFNGMMEDEGAAQKRLRR